MKKFLKILTIIISITLVIQLGTMSLNINQVQAYVGNFKSYKSKSSSSSKSYKSYKSSSPKTKIFKPHKSNSSSKNIIHQVKVIQLQIVITITIIITTIL